MKICSCAVIGQHPTRFKFKYNEYMTSCKRIKKRMHDVFVSLYQSGVRCFFVGGALGVDMWAGEILLDMQRQVEYRELDVVMVCPFPAMMSDGTQRARHGSENSERAVPRC